VNNIQTPQGAKPVFNSLPFCYLCPTAGYTITCSYF